MMRRLFLAVRWYLIRQFGGGLTSIEIRAHIQMMKKRRERLNRKSMALSGEIVYWESELRYRRDARSEIDIDELGI